MQNTLVKIIINITTPHTANNIAIVESENAKPSHLNNSLFTSYSIYLGISPSLISV